MTDQRFTASSITDDELDRLYEERTVLLAELNGRDAEARERWIQRQPARDMVAQWVGAARAMLGDAPNCTETPVEMVVKVGEAPERFAFTLQRVGKVTPHEARQAAEKALADVLGIVLDYVIESNDCGGIDANDLVTRLARAGHQLPDDEDDA